MPRHEGTGRVATVTVNGSASWERRAGLSTALVVEPIRRVNGRGKVNAPIRDVRSSFAGDPQGLAQAIRRHGSLKHSPHGVLLDVTFRQDDSRVVIQPTRNVALLRQIAINVVGRHLVQGMDFTNQRFQGDELSWSPDEGADYIVRMLE